MIAVEKKAIEERTDLPMMSKSGLPRRALCHCTLKLPKFGCGDEFGKAVVGTGA